MTRLVVGITGASGSIYGIRLLEVLRATSELELHLVISAAGKRTLVEETDLSVSDVEALARHRYDVRDIGAPLASGSFRTAGMVIAPCSIKTAGAIAACYADTLVSRAADVTLKEGRPLILVVRETPLHLGHLRVLTALAEMGAVILPPMPAFYNRPKDLDDVVNHTVARVLDRLQLPQTLVGGVAGWSTVACPRGRRWLTSRSSSRSTTRKTTSRSSGPELRERAGAARPALEVVFVDDGSRDRSAEIIRAFRERRFAGAARAAQGQRRRDRRHRRRVQGGAAARGGQMDADLQNDPRDIPTLLPHLDRWDAVTGWRVKRGDGDSAVRRISSRIANGVRNRLSHESIQDSGCTFRAFRRECLRELVLYRGFHRFIPTLLRMRGYRVIEVPVHHRPRRFGQSKYGVLNRVFVATVDLLAVRWMKHRLLRYEVAEDLGGDLIRD